MVISLNPPPLYDFLGIFCILCIIVLYILQNLYKDKRGKVDKFYRCIYNTLKLKTKIDETARIE